jgi:hypothetical protein
LTRDVEANTLSPAAEIWGNFITEDNPSIMAAIPNGASSSSFQQMSPASAWSVFNMYAPYQINLNETRGVPFSATNGAGNPAHFNARV